MSFALNEVEAMARKAARGAGLSWGMAEEAAKATRWLCAQGLDGCAALACALSRAESDAAGPCPLATGTALSDDAAALPAKIDDVIAPLLLLPFAALAAQAQGTAVTITWDGGYAVTDGERLALHGAPLSRRAGVALHRGGTLTAPRARHSRATPRPEDWRQLDQLAHRIYAPETDRSRLAGAGAGLTDND